ncbi:MAG: Dabb family protein [Clostridia bacterium]|nr:Dabb family protein [Clostridia bacterium]
MIKHIVMWNFNDTAEGKTKDENMNIVKNGLLALEPIIPEIKYIQLGNDISHTEMSYDLALITEFENLDDLQTYKVHPEHQKVANYVAKVTNSRGVIDFSF